MSAVLDQPITVSLHDGVIEVTNQVVNATVDAIFEEREKLLTTCIARRWGFIRSPEWNVPLEREIGADHSSLWFMDGIPFLRTYEAEFSYSERPTNRVFMGTMKWREV